MKLIGSIALGLALAGCGMTKPHNDDASPQGERSFALSGFESVSLAGSDNVDIVVGPAFSVTASGPQSLLDRLDISVDGTNLKVSRKPTMGWQSGKGARIRVTMPAITGANVAGSGDMTIDKVEGDRFDAGVAGSGDLSVKAIKVQLLEANIVGSGDVSLWGNADKAAMSIAGSGSIRADELTTVTTTVSIVGSGDVSARVTGAVTGNLAGSGDLNVRGTGKCTVSKVGSGDINCQP